MRTENEEIRDHLKYLSLLARDYPSQAAAASEIISTQALLKLPKGTEHFMSDLHGENEAFVHILNSASGVIREKVDIVLGDTIPEGARAELATLIYYPNEKLPQLKARCADEDELEQVLLGFKESFDRERQAQDASEQYRRKARAAIVRELLLGQGELTLSSAAEISLLADGYQVVICEKYSQRTPGDLPDFGQLLRVNNQDSRAFDCVSLDGLEVTLLKGEAALQKFQALLQRFDGEGSAPQRQQLEGVFLCFGRPVKSMSQIALSYAQALHARSRRFFCAQEQHTLGYDALPVRLDAAPLLNKALLEEYASRLLNYVQTFNRNKMAQTLGQLQSRLYTAPDSIASIKLFFTDLHLQIKEQMNRLYPSNSIPFYSNAQLIRTIDEADFLYEIIRFLAQRFEIMMSSIGTSSRDSVLDDILHYIDHNYAQNITLENIAPLFGYNHSYLGKIFSKKTGQSFNSYVDHVRIEQAKRLLLQDDSKVYTVAERVGYKNVDYFHIKFKKYVGQSPAEFRKRNKGTSE